MTITTDVGDNMKTMRAWDSKEKTLSSESEGEPQGFDF